MGKYLMILVLLALSVSCAHKNIEKNIIGTWIETGRACDEKGKCKITPNDPQTFYFKNNSTLIINNSLEAYYSYKNNHIIIAECEEVKETQLIADDPLLFIKADEILIGDKSHRYKYTRKNSK
jgi:hypothetical protein